MRYILPVILVILSAIFLPINVGKVSANTQETVYYRIIAEDTLLYRDYQNITSIENQFFYLENSYFVQYLDEVEEFYLVNYQGIVGYVAKENVIPVYSTPTTPFPKDATLEITNYANAIIFSHPNTSSDFCGTIPFNTKNVKILGYIFGENPDENIDNKWYYVRYTSFEQGIVTGYIYASLTKNQTQIPDNMEIVETEPSVTANASVFAPELQTSSNLLLLICLTIPAIFLLYLFIKPQRNKNKTNNNVKRLPYKTNQGDDELNF